MDSSMQNRNEEKRASRGRKLCKGCGRENMAAAKKCSSDTCKKVFTKPGIGPLLRKEKEDGEKKRKDKNARSRWHAVERLLRAASFASGFGLNVTVHCHMADKVQLWSSYETAGQLKSLGDILFDRAKIADNPKRNFEMFVPVSGQEEERMDNDGHNSGIVTSGVNEGGNNENTNYVILQEGNGGEIVMDVDVGVRNEEEVDNQLQDGHSMETDVVVREESNEEEKLDAEFDGLLARAVAIMEGSKSESESEEERTDIGIPEKILKHTKTHGVVKYLVRWAGYGKEHDSLQTEDDFSPGCPVLRRYKETKQTSRRRARRAV